MKRICDLIPEFDTQFDDVEIQNMDLEQRQKLLLSDVCPECFSKLIHENGCLHCRFCGFEIC